MEIGEVITPEINNQAEEFFKKIYIEHFSNKEDFLEMMKIKYPDDSEEEILRHKGVNFKHDGKFYIFIRTDIFPEEYIPYVETHEKWELFMAFKKGYNLFARTVHEYKKDKNVEFSKENLKEFYRNVDEYNYDFRHEYAVYKEYEHAQKDGKLDKYHNWMMSLRPEEKKRTKDESILRRIENDTQIRNSIYKKLTEGSNHSFLRK